MQIPEPEAGLVISYSYLWRHEAEKGLEEGRKDRPCAVILATRGNRVYVAPITHSPPTGSEAIEIPMSIKKQIGLDDERSWLVTSEVNEFQWPGLDLRPISRQQPSRSVYGKLPPNFTNQVKQEIQKHARAHSLKRVNRDDEGATKVSEKPDRETMRQNLKARLVEQRERSKGRTRDRGR